MSGGLGLDGRWSAFKMHEMHVEGWGLAVGHVLIFTEKNTAIFYTSAEFECTKI